LHAVLEQSNSRQAIFTAKDDLNRYTANGRLQTFRVELEAFLDRQTYDDPQKGEKMSGEEAQFNFKGP
jgi:hypothetical protein